jgi:hypothetical protein
MTRSPPPTPPHKGEGSKLKKKSWHDSLPFPRHWLAYIVLKLAVIVLAAVLVLRYFGKL